MLILQAEEILADPECKKMLEDCDSNYRQRINEFLSLMDDHHPTQPFRLWTGKENEFKKQNIFQKICDIVAIAECYNFEKRATLLKERHPLSMQVDLQSGVANGVLVVRSSEECARLLHKTLTNQLEFKIKHIEYDDEEIMMEVYDVEKGD